MYVLIFVLLRLLKYMLKDYRKFLEYYIRWEFEIIRKEKVIYLWIVEVEVIKKSINF